MSCLHRDTGGWHSLHEIGKKVIRKIKASIESEVGNVMMLSACVEVQSNRERNSPRHTSVDIEFHASINYLVSCTSVGY